MSDVKRRKYLSEGELQTLLSNVKSRADLARERGTTRAIIYELIFLLSARVGLVVHWELDDVIDGAIAASTMATRHHHLSRLASSDFPSRTVLSQAQVLLANRRGQSGGSQQSVERRRLEFLDSAY